MASHQSSWHLTCLVAQPRGPLHRVLQPGTCRRYAASAIRYSQRGGSWAGCGSAFDQRQGHGNWIHRIAVRFARRAPGIVAKAPGPYGKSENV